MERIYMSQILVIIEFERLSSGDFASMELSDKKIEI